MGERLNNVKDFFADSKRRAIVILAIFVLLLGIAYGVIHFHNVLKGPKSGASISNLTRAIKSTPAGSAASIEYSKLQTEQNLNNANKAIKSGKVRSQRYYTRPIYRHKSCNQATYRKVQPAMVIKTAVKTATKIVQPVLNVISIRMLALMVKVAVAVRVAMAVVAWAALVVLVRAVSAVRVAMAREQTVLAVRGSDGSGTNGLGGAGRDGSGANGLGGAGRNGLGASGLGGAGRDGSRANGFGGAGRNGLGTNGFGGAGANGANGVGAEGVGGTGAKGFGGAGAGGNNGIDADKLAGDLAKIRAQQLKQLNATQLNNALQEQEAGMATQAQALFTSWMPVPAQAYTQGPDTSAEDAAAAKAATEKAAAGIPGKTIVTAGKVLFGLLITAVNSDEPGPIMARIISGKYKGAKLIGSLTPVTQYQDKVALNFNTMILPKATSSISIDAVAIDPDDARTALSSYTNNHYFMRYGALFAASFLSGYSKALTQQGTTSLAGLNLANDLSKTRCQSQRVGVGLGEVGNQFAGILSSQFGRPPTIHVYSGTSIGVLFLSDATQAKP